MAEDMPRFKTCAKRLSLLCDTFASASRLSLLLVLVLYEGFRRALRLMHEGSRRDVCVDYFCSMPRLCMHLLYVLLLIYSMRARSASRCAALRLVRDTLACGSSELGTAGIVSVVN